jgi:RHS repeat-associated protein
VSRIASETDLAGATRHYTYDAADRPLSATYPDGTTSRLAYTLLDLTSYTDRLHQTTHANYDADRELTSTTDPDGNTVHQGYNLAGKLNSITDANGHTTTFVLDAESRVTGKQFANGTSLSILYDSSLSRVATVTDALNQTTDYTYNADNTTATESYSAQQATPSVSFTYDPIYPRPTSMTDGVGITIYNYYPVSSSPALGANQLQSISSPIAGASGTDIIAYSYDALNRVVGYTINGIAQSIGFDVLGRVTSASNPLDSFTYSYSDGTSRVTGVSSNSGPTAALTYFGPTGDELLEQLNITTHTGSTSLAQFGYTYNADDNVKTFAVSSPSAQTTTYAYDKANRAVSALIGTGTPQYVYGYDHASNLTSITPNGATQSFSYTSTNVIASGTYDLNGSPTALSGKSYKWDGANRIVRFANTANNTGSSFTYDGTGHLVRVVDTHAGAITADHSYTWCGNIRCLAHDNTQTGSPVTTQYFDQGAIVGGTPYYYVKDKLGSVTELVSSTGSVASQYTYDPYGNQARISGSLVSDIGYSGYFYHAASGLAFALYRAYDPTHARWLNRDPIAEFGGINLYAYVNGNPVRYRDPTGKDPFLALIGAVGGFGYGYVAGLIEGQSGSDLYLHALEDAGIGGLTGLTDGLNLIPRVLANAGINAVGEAYKEEVSYMKTGCPREFNGTKIALAGFTSVLGDLGGNLVGNAFAGHATELTHILQESSLSVEQFVNTNIYGALSLAAPIIDRATH